MLNEQERVKLQVSTIEQQKAECQEIIKTAAIYERLEANTDWLACMDHLKQLADIHQRQINGWMDQMESCSFFKRIKIMDTIMVHQTRKTQISEAINYPKSLIHQARQAREFLQTLREKENENATH